MKPGPKPTPTTVLRLRGSSWAEGRSDEPLAPRGRPEPPPELELAADPLAEVCWDRLCDHLETMGVLAVTDADAIAQYAICWARWTRAVVDIRRRGETELVRDRSGNVTSKVRASVKIEADLGARLLRLGSGFGLTPSARAGLRLPEPTDEGFDPIEAALAGD